jgi:hypothetical protein
VHLSSASPFAIMAPKKASAKASAAAYASRHENRRFVQAKALRIEDRNFSHLSLHVRCVLTSDGLNMRTALENMVESNPTGYVSGQQLHGHATQYLILAPEFRCLNSYARGTVDPLLIASMRQWLNANTSKNSKAPLLSWLRCTPQISEQEFCGILKPLLPTRPSCASQHVVFKAVLETILRLKLMDSMGPKVSP